MAGPRDWRVDTLSPSGESDLTRDEDGGWTWDSADRRGTRLTGALDVRIPQPPALVPTSLGNRLAGSRTCGPRHFPAAGSQAETRSAFG